MGQYEGKSFKFGLENGTEIHGIVTHQNGELLLSHFFDLKGLVEGENKLLTPQHAIYAAVHGPLGFEDQDWELVEPFAEMNWKEWSIPAFKLQDPLLNIWFKIELEPDLLTQRRNRISPEEAEDLFPHGVSGHVFIQETIADLL